MAASPSIMVKILGDVAGLGKSFDQTRTKGQSAAQGMHSAFSGMLNQLNSTGVLGPFGQALSTADQSLQNMEGHAKKTTDKMLGLGSAAAGVGFGLAALGSKDQAAHQQLQAAIGATGHSYEQYSAQVDAAVGHQEKFGHTADDTQGALRVLTQATHDPNEALKLLNETTDLAAAKHEDLTTAAGQVGKAYNGSARIFKEFGVVVTKNKDGTKDYHKAIGDLGDRLKGQASASVATFHGKLNELKATVQDHVSLFGQKYGPAIGTAGLALAGLASVLKGVSAATEALKLKQIAQTVVTGIATAITWLWNAALGVAETLEAIVGAPIWLIIAAVVAFVAAIAAAAYFIIKYWHDISAAVGVAISFMTGLWNSFVAFFSGIPGQIAAIAANMWHWVSDAFSTAVGVIQSVWGGIWNWFTGLPGAIGNIAKGMWNGIGNAFVDALNFVIGVWDGLHFTIPSVGFGPFHTPSFDLGLPTVPKIPHMAEGGLITESGLIFAHAGEAIIPAPATTRSGPAVVVQNANFNNGLDIDAFMKKAAWHVRTQRL
jgi:hypothetical protein